MVLFGACSATPRVPETPDPISLPSSQPEGVSRPTTTIDRAAEIAEVRQLWASALTAFQASRADRPTTIGALGDKLPADTASRLEARLPNDAGELTSNATYEPAGPDRVSIADCALSSEPSLLGPTTAGFKATATRADTASPWELVELDDVVNCVPKQQADRAMAAYQVFLSSYERLWANLDSQDPALALVTDKTRATLTDSFATFRQRGWRVKTTIAKQTAEVVAIEGEGAIVINECTNYAPGSGTYDANGAPVEGFVDPSFGLLSVRMAPDGPQWKFDGYTYLTDSCLFAPTDQAATLL
jgi:hypothetical protein